MSPSCPYHGSCSLSSFFRRARGSHSAADKDPSLQLAKTTTKPQAPATNVPTHSHAFSRKPEDCKSR